MKLTQTIRKTLTSQKNSRTQDPKTRTQGTQTTSVEAPKATWHGERNDEGIPLRMICPISQSIMHDPVVASDGHTYDRPMIMKIITSEHCVSPFTREALKKDVFPNGSLQREVAAFLQAEPSHAPQLSAGQKRALEQAEQSGVAKHRAIAILLASSLLSDAEAEAFLYEMPLAAPSPSLAASIPPGHPGSGVAPPRRLPTGDGAISPRTRLDDMTAQWEAMLDEAMRHAEQQYPQLGMRRLPGSQDDEAMRHAEQQYPQLGMRRLPGSQDLVALRTLSAQQLSARVGTLRRVDSLRSESSADTSAPAPRRASEDSTDNFDFSALTAYLGDDFMGR